MNTFFRLRKAALFVVAGLAAVFMVAGCKGDDGDETGGGNNASAASLTSVSIKGPSDIAADGTGTLTATAGYTGEIASYITYKWEIASGKDSAEIVGTGSKATIKGTNTTEQSKSVTVKVTAAYDGTTKTATHTVTIAAKGASVKNEITGLELVPPTSSVACDGQVTLTPKVTYTGNLTESDFTVTWEITDGSDYAELVDPSAKARGELTFTGGNTRILQAKNTTNSKQLVTVSVTVSAGGKPFTKKCTVTVDAASTTENRIWTWNPSYAAAVAAVSSDTDIKDSENDTSVTLISGAAISESSLTDSEGATYSNALYFNGGGSKVLKAVKFAVAGACKIFVVARSSGDSERSLILSDGSNELATFPAVLKSATPAPQSYDYTGGSGTLYLYSKSGGINVYLIQAVYGSSSSSSVTTVTISGNQSVVVGNSVMLTATPNATATGAYTWEITAGAGSVTLGSSTTNKVMVTGKAAGTAKITAAVDGVTSAPYTVTVREAGAKEIFLDDEPVGYAEITYPTGKGTTVTTKKELTDALSKGGLIYVSGEIDVSEGCLPSTAGGATSALDSFVAANDSTYKTYEDFKTAYAASCSAATDDKSSSAPESTLGTTMWKLNKAYGEKIKLTVKSNTTIIGLAGAVIKGGTFQISNASNVVIRNLTIRDAYDPFPHHESDDGFNAQWDNIAVVDSSYNIWIDHCTLEDTMKYSKVTIKDGEQEKWQTYDGLCDITKSSHNVVVSYCLFKNHDKTMLIGSGSSDVNGSNITIHHNRFLNCGQRLPMTCYSNMHIYNNSYERDSDAYYNQTASIAARYDKYTIIAENNYFGKDVKKCITASTNAKGKCYESGNMFVSGSCELSTQPNKPFTPSYTYDLDKASDIPEIVAEDAGAGVWTVQQ